MGKKINTRTRIDTWLNKLYDLDVNSECNKKIINYRMIDYVNLLREKGVFIS